MVVWSSLAEARRCLNGESSCKYEVLLSFEDRELPYQDSYSELKGVWAASRPRGFINITCPRRLPNPRRMPTARSVSTQSCEATEVNLLVVLSIATMLINE